MVFSFFYWKEGATLKELSRLHPFAAAAYFAAVLFFSMFVFHPLLLSISLSGAIFLGIWARSARTIFYWMLGLLPGLVLVVFLNVFFGPQTGKILYQNTFFAVHQASLVTGLLFAALLLAMVLWFASFQVVLTKDKILYVCGRLFSSLGLLLSMIFRLVPIFSRQLKKIQLTQRSLGFPQKTLREKTAFQKRVYTLLFTWGGEYAVQMTDSMRARGYGTKKRTTFNPFYSWRTAWKSLAFILLVSTAAAWCLRGEFGMRFFAEGFSERPSQLALVGNLLFLLLVFLPVWLHLAEIFIWRHAQTRWMRAERSRR